MHMHVYVYMGGFWWGGLIHNNTSWIELVDRKLSMRETKSYRNKNCRVAVAQ